MFDKFGEFDSFSEINELAENLLNECDILVQLHQLYLI